MYIALSLLAILELPGRSPGLGPRDISQNKLQILPQESSHLPWVIPERWQGHRANFSKKGLGEPRGLHEAPSAVLPFLAAALLAWQHTLS